MFKDFKDALLANFNTNFSKEQWLFSVDVDKDKLWNTYLSNFPESERQNYNCNSCRGFIKNYGNLVKINPDYTITSIWDFKIDNPEYQQVANALRNLVLTCNIKNLFITDTLNLGTDSNVQQLEDKSIIKREHFYIDLTHSIVGKYKSKDIPTKLNDYSTAIQVFERALKELTIDATTTVLDLIKDNAIYRGAENKDNLQTFLKSQKDYQQCQNKTNYCWYVGLNNPNICKIKNTSIGTLLIDISKGIDIEEAVRKYESVVAPQNYKRPKAVVTSAMVSKAKDTITKLGYLESLERRYATLDDLTIDNVLYINRTKTNKDLFSSLDTKDLVNPRTIKGKEITLDEFLTTYLPKTKNVELLVENKSKNNLVSLLTASNSDSPTMFKWNNQFSWSYTGGLSDSLLKQKVEKAGGKVDGFLRVSLEWYNTDDLDLHLIEPKTTILYSNKQSRYTLGELDVDMNFTSPLVTDPVENIIYPYNHTMTNGIYEVEVHQFSNRNKENYGFKIELEYNNEIYEFYHNEFMVHKKIIPVLKFEYKDGKVTILTNIEIKLNSKSFWNISSNKFNKVKAITYSPNYWGYDKGNKHLLLFLDNCIADESPRGFYNEYIKDELLTKHKRVFEILGNKVEIANNDSQLSGLGFSTTQSNSFVVKLDNKIYKVII